MVGRATTRPTGTRCLAARPAHSRPTTGGHSSRTSRLRSRTVLRSPRLTRTGGQRRSPRPVGLRVVYRSDRLGRERGLRRCSDRRVEAPRPRSGALAADRARVVEQVRDYRRRARIAEDWLVVDREADSPTDQRRLSIGRPSGIRRLMHARGNGSSRKRLKTLRNSDGRFDDVTLCPDQERACDQKGRCKKSLTKGPAWTVNEPTGRFPAAG